MDWHNWSGSVAARPQRIERPKTRAELAGLIQAAVKVRVTGAGHSFMPLCETDGALVSLTPRKKRSRICVLRTSSA